MARAQRSASLKTTLRVSGPIQQRPGHPLAIQKLEAYEKQLLALPDQQISLTGPDCRSMATSGRGSGVVGYNVQVAAETEHISSLRTM